MTIKLIGKTFKEPPIFPADDSALWAGVYECDKCNNRIVSSGMPAACPACKPEEKEA